jgi:hypothetical protein
MLALGRGSRRNPVFFLSLLTEFNCSRDSHRFWGELHSPRPLSSGSCRQNCESAPRFSSVSRFVGFASDLALCFGP